MYSVGSERCAVQVVCGASCVTVNVFPATVSVPLRLAPVFAATVKLTVPLPLPLLPALIVIQLSLLVAVHVQPAVVVIFELPLPPAAVKVCVVGAIA